MAQDDSYRISEATVRRLAGAIDRLQQQYWDLRNLLGERDPARYQTPPPALVWITCSVAAIPAYGIVQISNAQIAGADDVLSVIQPTSTYVPGQYLACGPDGIGAGQIGLAAPIGRFQRMLYTGSAPSAGDWMGPTASNWYLTTGINPCVRVSGVLDSTKKILLGEWHTLRWVRGTLGADLSSGSSASFTPAGSVGPTTVYDNLLNSGQTISSGTTVDASLDETNGQWYVSAASCPS